MRKLREVEIYKYKVGNEIFDNFRQAEKYKDLMNKYNFSYD